MNSEWKNYYVPWADLSEWNTVREEILSSDPNKTIRAYETILMWKLKYDSVPAYVDCTYTILQVMVKEYEMTKSESLFNENDLQLSYSTALIRFVNHVSSISSYKGETLFLAAKTQNIPDWIVNMRHDVAHGQELPTLDALHLAAEISLKWLLDNYWLNKENFAEKSLDVRQLDLNVAPHTQDDINAQNFLKKVFVIWEFCHHIKSKSVVFIGELEREFILHVEEMLSLQNIYYSDFAVDKTDMQSVVNEYKKFEERQIDFTSTCRISDFKMLLLQFVQNVAKIYDFIQNSIVISLLETKFLSENNSLSKWEPVLHLMQDMGLFSSLLHILFQMTGEGHKGASNWLSILLPSLKLLHKQWAMYKILKKDKKKLKKKALKEKVQRSNITVEAGVTVRLDVCKPPALNLEMMSGVLLNPENYNEEEITQYLQLIRPPLLKSTIDLMKGLISLQSITVSGKEEGEVLDDEKIFTVEDLENVMQKKPELVHEEAFCEDKGWTTSSIDIHVWNKCPLGLLPFQSKVDCSVSSEIIWRRTTPSRKRTLLPLMVTHSKNMKKLREI